MLDQKPSITEERVVRPAPPPARRSWWLAGFVALLVVGLIGTAVVLIGDGETAQTVAYQYEPLRPGSGFFERLDPGRLPVVPSVVTPTRDYQRFGDRSGLLEGLDGPVGTVTAGPTREYLRIADRGGFLEGLDGPVTSIAVVPTAVTTATETYRPLRPGSGFFEGLDPGPPPEATTEMPAPDDARIGEHGGVLEGLD